MMNIPDDTRSFQLCSWLAEQNFTHAFTMMPGVASFNRDDAVSLAHQARHYLATDLFGETEPNSHLHDGKDLWFHAVAEVSLARELWHIHGGVRLTSKRLARKYERNAQSLLMSVLYRYTGRGGVKALSPTVKIERLVSSKRWTGYSCKRLWNDSEIVL